MIKNWCFASNGSFVYSEILSIPGSWFIRFSNAFVFPDPELPIIHNLYKLSGICVHLEFVFTLNCLFYVFSCNITNVNHFLINSVYLCFTSSMKLGIVLSLILFINRIFDQWGNVVIFSSSWIFCHQHFAIINILQ